MGDGTVNRAQMRAQCDLSSMKCSVGAPDSSLTAPSSTSPGFGPLRSATALSATEKKMGMRSPAATRVVGGHLPPPLMALV